MRPTDEQLRDILREAREHIIKLEAGLEMIMGICDRPEAEPLERIHFVAQTALTEERG